MRTWYEAHAAARAGAPPPGAAQWRLSLASGGRGVVTTAIVLGVIFYVLYFAVLIPTFLGVVNSPSVKLNVAYDNLASAVQQNDTAACPDAGDPLACYRQGDQALAAAFTQFATTVRGIDFPAANVGEAQKVEQDASQLAGDFSSLAQATGSVDQYDTAQQSSTVNDDLGTFESDYSTLRLSLSF